MQPRDSDLAGSDDSRLLRRGSAQPGLREMLAGTDTEIIADAGEPVPYGGWTEAVDEFTSVSLVVQKYAGLLTATARPSSAGSGTRCWTS